MNAHAPPKKAPGAGEQTGRDLIAARAYHAVDVLQARSIWDGWKREGMRLFSDFWRTADEKHLAAFGRHVVGMRSHQRGAAQ